MLLLTRSTERFGYECHSNHWRRNAKPTLALFCYGCCPHDCDIWRLLHVQYQLQRLPKATGRIPQNEGNPCARQSRGASPEELIMGAVAFISFQNCVHDDVVFYHRLWVAMCPQNTASPPSFGWPTDCRLKKPSLYLVLMTELSTPDTSTLMITHSSSPRARIRSCHLSIRRLLISKLLHKIERLSCQGPRVFFVSHIFKGEGPQ